MKRSHLALVVAALVIVAVVVLGGLAVYVNRSATLTVFVYNSMDETVFFSLVVKGESNVSGYLVNHSGVIDEFKIQWLGFGDKSAELSLWYGPLGIEQLQTRKVILSEEGPNDAFFDLGSSI